MKTLTVRMDELLYDELVSIAQARDISLSDLARDTLGKLMRSADGESEQRRPEVPNSLSAVNRLQLSLLHRILARLVEGDGDDGDPEYQFTRAKVLERGYVVEYSDEFSAIEPELSPRETEFVMDVLDMFTQLDWSYGELPTAQRDELGTDTPWQIRFAGFDLNNRREGRLCQYARHLIDDDKWERLAVYFDDKHERGNSHMPTYATYTRMLEVFQPIWKRKIREGSHGATGMLLTVDEIRKITEARIHPTNRSPK